MEPAESLPNADDFTKRRHDLACSRSIDPILRAAAAQGGSEMRIIAVALILAVRLEAAARECSDLCGREAVRGYSYLLASTGFVGEVEHAAFVVQNPDGTIRLVRWTSNVSFKARYRGVVPAGCIAIAHTHPNHQVNPSPHDIAEAQRIHMPILVITPDAVTVAHADGNVEMLFDAGWTSTKR